MISLSKTGNAIKFTFTDNGHYLQNGTIEVPVNSLTLVTDDSDMFTFKKSATNDIFVSGLYSEIGMTKAELETYYKDNMVGSTGGGGGDITSGEVQTMIDESISGKADTSAVTESINEAVSGKVDESAFTAYSGAVDSRILEDERVTSAALNVLNTNKLDASAYTPTDLSNYYTSAQTDSKIAEATSGKADTSAVTESINAAVSGKVDTSTYTAYTAATDTVLSGKQDTLSAGTNITISGNVISAEGGGKAIEAGRGISVTTGTTADTVSFNLPISAGTGTNSVIIGGTSTNNGSNNLVVGSDNNISSGSRSLVVGYRCRRSGDGGATIGWNSATSGDFSISLGENCTASAKSSFARGSNINASTNYSFASGYYIIANNYSEHSCGQFNVSSSGSSSFGNSGNTLFSVGNGTDNNNRHNAFEIRQNGDIYITSGGTDIKLQDNLGGGVSEATFSAYTASTNSRLAEDEEVTAAALNNLSDNFGGLKLMKLTQNEYNALSPNYDSNTLYVIVN